MAQAFSAESIEGTLDFAGVGGSYLRREPVPAGDSLASRSVRRPMGQPSRRTAGEARTKNPWRDEDM